MSESQHEVARPPRRSWKRPLGWSLAAVAVVGACVAARVYWEPAAAIAEPADARQAPAANQARKAAKAAAPAKSEIPEVVAVVNAERITRNDLARECLRLYGEEVLEMLINKRLIAQHCRERGVSVTKKEVQDEIDRMAQRFGLPPDQWLKMLENERKINPQQYAKDIIWPMIALRKLADEQLQVTRADVQRAYQTYYGPAVQTRLIACDSAEEAERVRAMAVQDPDEFGNLAKQYSKDPSASAKGLILPIRKHLGDPNIEQAAFSMTEGDISHVIQVGQQYLILKCESIQQAKGVPLAQVEKVLIDSIRDKKLRLVADDVFDKLQKQSQVENVYNDPAKRDAQPGVAALVNGQAMTVRELADECLARHGTEVLDDMIKRRLLVQACQRNKVEVTERDMEQEIARAAVAMGMPDVKSWLREVVDVHKLSLETYRQDEVWPTAALKKLVGKKVQITEDDMHKSYEANYGPRVRCRAIVLSQLRQAQQVWELARDNPGVESFGALAEQYSVEPGSRALQGEVPPIQRHGGQPLLEQEAFSLAEGELSGVVQVGDKYVILLCEGHTQPIDVSFDEVKQLIYEDLHEKKLRLVMAEEFTRLEDEAQIDNYLAGTSKAPVKSRLPLGAKGGRPAGPAQRS